ncbi:pleckstrin homology domain-containing family A member 7 isoform X2 [Seriola aureovittata]|uniref:pleckstrin homology domain-containing family A member 7 isoform X2 n=1 Tax=Seriola aureovittata TaxID=2871759 RepID=UPI0024BECAF2|nr:pleckstrin homology domain-containing family A member 7 isoform X2 [Seriola aureovittata]
MELEAASRRIQLVRMDDQDRVSQASSVATISYFPVTKESDGRVQTFGKRCQAAKRDPNCPVVIRGWLNKKDSSGLKLWKRRWFVLSNYCLFYYKDSREESVLGSIPLPSYKILFCTPRECKNRKFTFKVVHQGMRSYFFSADTQEDMLGWVRALSQSAAMEPDSSMNRRCSSYQDFTQIGGSSESVDFPKSPSDGEGPSQKHRHVSRTLSEPSHLTGGRMGTSHSEHRGRRRVRHRNSSPSNRTPSPAEFSRRRAFGPNQEEDSFPGQNTPPTQTEIMGTGSLTSRGQLGSRPHTPVGRVDIRPHDDPVMVPQTLYYAPASPKLEFKSTPTTPVSERWQNLSQPTPTYGSVHHMPSGRRPLGKSYSTGAHADLLPPLPPSSRAAHAPHPPHHHHHHHHHLRSHLSVCVLPPAMAQKHDSRETPPIRPLESDADAVLTRLCGCDKLLQSLSVELAQLQMDKDSVQCALEVSRLQLEEWQSQGPRAQEEALTQKALLQEDLVTIRARMCDVSLEMERVWSQYERMESELSVIRSHLQHICNFGIPQEQSQAQRELWMMEDILAGLKVNRDHFRFLLGLQRHNMFQQPAPHPGSPGSPTERLHSGLPMDVEQEPPARPALPQELLESQQGHGYTESPYEGIYSHAVDPAHRRGNSQPDLLHVKAPRDASDSQSGSKWIPPDTANQSTKKMKMSEEEQLERIKRNQERLTNRKKPPMPTPGVPSQSSETREEAPFPLRVTRVVTAVLPSSLVARRVSVEDPPAELDTPLPEQIPPEMQQRLAEQSKKMSNKPPRRLLLESPDQNRSLAEMQQDQPVKRTSRQQHLGALRSSKRESRADASRAEATETSRNQARDHAGLGNGRESSDTRAEERPTALLTPDMDPDLCLTPEQREAKLRRVERIRERVIRSAVRESVSTHNQQPIRGEKQDVLQVPPDTARKQRMKLDLESQPCYVGNYGDNPRSPAELEFSSGTSQDEDERDARVKKFKSQVNFGDKTQRKDHSGRAGVAKTKIRRPASPYHISSMTVYQKDGGKGFVSCKVEEETKLEEPAADDNESNSSSTDVRAKWFLSTNQWQGFIPLQIPGIDSLCSEEITDIEQQPACTDDVTESSEMSSTVCESLEKMKENHSLFYKIACDISISDTDITKNDGNTSVQPPCGPEEEEEPPMAESVPVDATSNVGTSPNQDSKDSSISLPSDVDENSLSNDNKLQDSTVETQDKAALNTSVSPATETRVYEENQQKECEDTSTQESQLKVKEANHGASAQDAGSNQGQGECAKNGEEHSWAKESEEKKVDQERSEELRKSRSSSEENKETVQERGGNNSVTPSSSVYEGGRMIRSASFRKARVTVLRTSL